MTGRPRGAPRGTPVFVSCWWIPSSHFQSPRTRQVGSDKWLLLGPQASKIFFSEWHSSQKTPGRSGCSLDSRTLEGKPEFLAILWGSARAHRASLCYRLLQVLRDGKWRGRALNWERYPVWRTGVPPTLVCAQSMRSLGFQHQTSPAKALKCYQQMLLQQNAFCFPSLF